MEKYPDPFPSHPTRKRWAWKVTLFGATVSDGWASLASALDGNGSHQGARAIRAQLVMLLRQWRDQ